MRPRNRPPREPRKRRRPRGPRSAFRFPIRPDAGPSLFQSRVPSGGKHPTWRGKRTRAIAGNVDSKKFLNKHRIFAASLRRMFFRIRRLGRARFFPAIFDPLIVEFSKLTLRINQFGDVIAMTPTCCSWRRKSGRRRIVACIRVDCPDPILLGSATGALTATDNGLRPKSETGQIGGSDRIYLNLLRSFSTESANNGHPQSAATASKHHPRRAVHSARTDLSKFERSSPEATANCFFAWSFLPAYISALPHSRCRRPQFGA